MGRQIEAKYIAEWLSIFHPYALQWRRVRLGPLPKTEHAKLYKIALRWADAIFVENGKVHIVEAKLRHDLIFAEQLNDYAKLFRNTPEFKVFWGYDVEKILLIPYAWKDMVQKAKEHGIKVEVFKPPWLRWDAKRARYVMRG